MSRVFWDTMLFVYLLEGSPEFAPKVQRTLERSYLRGDALFTSHLALGELMAGLAGDSARAVKIEATIADMGFSLVPFDGKCTASFAQLRSGTKLKAPDSIHLACAAAAGIDMYLTGDAQLLSRRVHVPGIHFITHFGMDAL